MRVRLSYDANNDCWTICHEQVRLDSSQAIQEWKRQLLSELRQKLGHNKGYILVDMQGFELDPSLANEYGSVAKEIISNYALGVIRYGAEGDLSASAVRVAAIRSRFPSNIFANREAALEALEQVRELPRETA